MSGPGKDGTAFNLDRWVSWATSPKTSSSVGLRSGNMPGARKKGTKAFSRSGGPRRACICGRMNHVKLKACPCGRVLA